MSTNEAYKQKIEAEIELAHAQLAELKAPAKSYAADARIKYTQQVEKLEQDVDPTWVKRIADSFFDRRSGGDRREGYESG